LKNSNKKSKKVQKLNNEVQKKTKQNRKKKQKKNMCFMPQSIDYAHRECEKVNTHKK